MLLPLILTRDRMEPLVRDPALLEAIAEGFVAFSDGRAVVPPPGELFFDNPRGEVHLKYGSIEGASHYVAKIASSFYDNPARGLSSSQGVVLAFRRETGELAGVLLDGGLLTDVRTAVAGALCVRHLARRDIQCVGIVGTGIQARLQLTWVGHVTPCRKAIVWGRDPEKVRAYQVDLKAEGFDVEAARSPEALRVCDVVITTTPSHEPLLGPEHLGPGATVVAIGSDTPDKQELKSSVLARAGLIVVDSRAHCVARGEVSHALKDGSVRADALVELGEILNGRHSGRRSDEELVVADLTGLAVQDIQIASFVLSRRS